MKLLDQIKKYINDNSDKKIAMFVDMDGVIASLDVDLTNHIYLNTPNWFFEKKPLKSVINMLNEISKINNVDLYILSACMYKEQALDKAKWLERYAPFFKPENQIYVIKEIVKYTKETKPQIKVNFILETLNNGGYDLAIYFEDEVQMLTTANKMLKEKIFCIHISNFIE